MKAPPVPKPRILLVEDNRELRQALRALLEDAGVEVVAEGANGSEGVDLARSLDPDVVLMDLRMPVMGGLEATRIIKEGSPTTQVVILTAYGDPALKDAAVGSGAYAYLVKGCPPRMVGEVTLRAAEMRRALRDRGLQGS